MNKELLLILASQNKFPVKKYRNFIRILFFKVEFSKKKIILKLGKEKLAIFEVDTTPSTLLETIMYQKNHLEINSFTNRNQWISKFYQAYLNICEQIKNLSDLNYKIEIRKIFIEMRKIYRSKYSIAQFIYDISKFGSIKELNWDFKLNNKNLYLNFHTPNFFLKDSKKSIFLPDLNNPLEVEQIIFTVNIIEKE